MDDVSPQMRSFLNYLKGHAPDDNLSKKIDTAVQKVKNQEGWRIEYMTLQEHYDMWKEAGLEEGREEGREEGIEIGRTEGSENKMQEIVLYAFSKGKTPEEIADFTGTPLETVKKILEESPTLDLATP